MAAPWLIVAGDFSPAGGMDRANYELAWHLAERAGRQVTLVAHRVAAPLATHPRVTVRPVRRPAGRHLLGSALLDRAGRAAAAALTTADPAAIVLVNGGNCRWPGANWVHLVHRGYAPDDDGAPWWYRLKGRLTHLYHCRREGAALRATRVVIANSDVTRRLVIEAAGADAGRVHRVYLGVDPAAYSPVTPRERAAARARLGLAPAAPVLAFVGALGHDRRKGFDTLLAALPALAAARGERVALLAAGGGALDRWRAAVAARGLAGDVRLLGPIDYVPTLLAAADVLVSPARYEPYGLNVHEALCRGVPAVVSRGAGVAERYPPALGGLLLDDPNDAAELARTLADVLRRREDYLPGVARLGEELRAWTWNDMAAAMVRLIEGAAVAAPV